MKKTTAVQKKSSSSSRNDALKNFLRPKSSLLTLEPIYVLVLWLCFIGNVILLHLLGRFGGGSIIFQGALIVITLILSAVFGYNLTVK
jgi:hypothetical protein